MILSLLRTGEVGWGGLAMVLRAAYYAGSLGGAGLAFFALLFGTRREAVDVPRLGRWAATAVLLGAVAGAAVLTAQVGELTGGELTGGRLEGGGAGELVTGAAPLHATPLSVKPVGAGLAEPNVPCRPNSVVPPAAS